MSNLDCYAALGITPGASKKEIKLAYHKMAKLYHPDRNPDDAQAEFRFKQVSLAYEVLKDDKKRKKYDEMSVAATAAAQPVPEPKPARHEYTSTSADDFAPRGAGGGGFEVDFTLLQEEEPRRYVIAAFMVVAAFVLAIGGSVLSLIGLVTLPIVLLCAWHWRDDIGYLICIAAPRHACALWLFVLMATLEPHYAAIFNTLPIPADSKSPASFLFAPVHTAFFIAYAISAAGWKTALRLCLGGWAVTLFMPRLKTAGWLFFAFLFLLTCAAKYDTRLMSDFVVYYYNLFALEPVKPL